MISPVVNLKEINGAPRYSRSRPLVLADVTTFFQVAEAFFAPNYGNGPAVTIQPPMDWLPPYGLPLLSNHRHGRHGISEKCHERLESPALQADLLAHLKQPTDSNTTWDNIISCHDRPRQLFWSPLNWRVPEYLWITWGSLILRLPLSRWRHPNSQRRDGPNRWRKRAGEQWHPCDTLLARRRSGKQAAPVPSSRTLLRSLRRNYQL